MVPHKIEKSLNNYKKKNIYRFNIIFDLWRNTIFLKSGALWLVALKMHRIVKHVG